MDEFDAFLRGFKDKDVTLRYLFEYEPLSTAGGLFHYRDQITRGLADWESFLLLNCDVCSLYPLNSLIKVHNEAQKMGTVLCVKSEIKSSTQYGCIYIRDDEPQGIVDHYVEKPESFVSSTISCGIYILNVKIMTLLKSKFLTMKMGETAMSLERDILPDLAAQGELYGCVSSNPFVQIKSAASAVSASEIYLNSWRTHHLTQLSTGENISGDVYIHPTAKVDPNAKLGPNVTVGANAKIEKGTRIRNAIILDDVHVDGNTLSI